MKIVIHHGGNSSLAGTQATFHDGVITLGRRPGNTITFDPHRDGIVSGHHAEIRVTANRVTIRDLGSANKTFVDGQMLGSEERELRSGNMIVLGTDGPMLKL
ncbi:FHA domain-containing protein, partial [Corallococcus sp. AB049A]|uniref:FHA domain-containing protein n=1 Tax=Corallococcus sp. AB049A TaxID=2316721 RepID=UPI000ED4A14F